MNIKPEQIKKLKDEGNKFYGQANYGKAITCYKEAVELCDKFWMQNDEYLPPKYEFGDQGECKDGLMYH